MVLKSLESNLSLSLRNVTMHDLDFLIDLIRHKQSVCLRLGRCENDGLSQSTINDKQISQCLLPVVIRTIDSDVVDVPLRLVLEVLCQINHLPIRSEVRVCHVMDPFGDSRREEKELWWFIRSLLDCLENLVNILFESHVQHLVGFIKYK